jgi:gliding motility-associated-like protein
LSKLKNRIVNIFIYKLLLFSSVNFLYAQTIVDECLSSVTPLVSNDFSSTMDVVNVQSADVVEWDGNNWLGGFPMANITIAPPTNQIGCRAIFLGNGLTWTSNGEAIGLRLDNPLVAGTAYTFDITYVSHGLGSDGVFSPLFYTNSTSSQFGATFVGNLLPVGFNWETNSLSFVASSLQDGDEWVILRTNTTSTSGLISSFCQNCTVVVPNCDITVNDVFVCEGDSATIIASSNSTGNFNYQWSVPVGATDPGDVSSFNTNVSGTYSVVATDIINNCVANGTGNLVFNSIPNITVNSDFICEDSSTTIIASTSTNGNYTYQWTVPVDVQNPGNVSSFTTDTAGNYTVLVTDTDTDCNVTATGIITTSSKPIITVNNETICEGSSTLLTASTSTTGNYEYLWTVPIGVSNPGNVSSFPADVDGMYSVIVNDIDTSCSSDSVSTSLNYYPDFEFTIDQYCEQDDFILEVLPTNGSFNLENSSFIWELNNSTTIGNDPKINLSSYLNFTSVVEDLPLNISVIVTSNNACSKTSTFTIEQVLCSIPEGISPNNDGINDSLDLTLLNVKKLQIFNRYGRIVYQKNSYVNEWYGQTNSGDILPTGTYFYVIELTDGSEPQSSWIYLNR